MTPSLRERLRGASRPLFGSWLSSASPIVADALRDLPFDWLLVDTEHAPANAETVAATLALLRAGGTAPLVRVGSVDPYPIKQALDAGAEGILVPLVSTAAQARAAVAASKYPPLGARGAAASAASRYGRELGTYLRTANESVLVGVQIETREALDNLDAIAEVDGVDLLFVGPQDLAMSLGLVDARAHDEVRAAMRRVIATAARTGRAAGTLAATPEEKRVAVELGFRFIGLASDLRFMLAGARLYLDG